MADKNIEPLKKIGPDGQEYESYDFGYTWDPVGSDPNLLRSRIAEVLAGDPSIPTTELKAQVQAVLDEAV